MTAESADTSGIHLWLILMKAHQALQKHAERSLQGIEMCFSDFVIMEALLHKGPMPVNRIGDKLLLTSGSLTAAVDRLSARGWVERQAHETDRRSRIIHLTSAGRTVIQDIFGQHAEYFEDLMSVLSATDRKTLGKLVKKLGKAAQDRL